MASINPSPVSGHLITILKCYCQILLEGASRIFLLLLLIKVTLFSRTSESIPVQYFFDQENKILDKFHSDKNLALC